MNLLRSLLLMLCFCTALAASDLSITATSVKASTTALTKTGTAGVAVTAGQVVYYDSATRTYKLAKADALGTSNAEGIALHAAAANQPLRIVLADDNFTPGVSATEGTLLAVSAANAGGIAPVADLATGNFPLVFAIVLDGGHWKVDFKTPLKTGSALP